MEDAKGWFLLGSLFASLCGCEQAGSGLVGVAAVESFLMRSGDGFGSGGDIVGGVGYLLRRGIDTFPGVGGGF